MLPFYSGQMLYVTLFLIRKPFASFFVVVKAMRMHHYPECLAGCLIV
jgi:hypothetical protein